MEEIAFESYDGAKLRGSYFKPASDAVRGAVVLVHGLGEHGGRYRHVAEALTAAGYAVLAYDQRGHGRSPGRRGHAVSIGSMASDAAAALAWMRKRLPSAPLFLYGHSMGGGVALSAALRHRPDLAGLILTSPWLDLAFKPPALKEMLGKAVGTVMPGLTVSAGLRGGALYRNERMAAEDRTDPLLHGRISIGTYTSVMAEGRRSIAHAAEWTGPALILHGSADSVTSFEASRTAAARMGDGCLFVPWEGGYHELHNDVDRTKVLQKIVDWMNEVVSARFQ